MIYISYGSDQQPVAVALGAYVHGECLRCHRLFVHAECRASELIFIEMHSRTALTVRMPPSPPMRGHLRYEKEELQLC